MSGEVLKNGNILIESEGISENELIVIAFNCPAAPNSRVMHNNKRIAIIILQILNFLFVVL